MPEILVTPSEMRAWSDTRRLRGDRVAVVPTMGALHEGHLHLVRSAHEVADAVIVTIFVNPLQFNRRDDFEKYPRPIDRDVALCASVGAHAVYAPTASAMYPAGFETHVEPGALAEPMEGAMRPGHFRGVTTVVAKLFLATRPHVAVFGQKDFQQLAIIRRMTLDLDFGIEIVGIPTVREPDGLAMSSRNRRLTSADRTAAVCVPQALDAAAERFEHGERRADALEEAAARHIRAEPAARLEYASVVDALTLRRHDVVKATSVLAVAAWFGDVRLIDNVQLTL